MQVRLDLTEYDVDASSCVQFMKFGQLDGGQTVLVEALPYEELTEEAQAQGRARAEIMATQPPADGGWTDEVVCEKAGTLFFYTDGVLMDADLADIVEAQATA